MSREKKRTWIIWICCLLLCFGLILVTTAIEVGDKSYKCAIGEILQVNGSTIWDCATVSSGGNTTWVLNGTRLEPENWSHAVWIWDEFDVYGLAEFDQTAFYDLMTHYGQLIRIGDSSITGNVTVRGHLQIDDAVGNNILEVNKTNNETTIFHDLNLNGNTTIEPGNTLNFSSPHYEIYNNLSSELRFAGGLRIPINTCPDFLPVFNQQNHEYIRDFRIVFNNGTFSGTDEEFYLTRCSDFAGYAEVQIKNVSNGEYAWWSDGGLEEVVNFTLFKILVEETRIEAESINATKITSELIYPLGDLEVGGDIIGLNDFTLYNAMEMGYTFSSTGFSDFHLIKSGCASNQCRNTMLSQSPGNGLSDYQNVVLRQTMNRQAWTYTNATNLALEIYTYWSPSYQPVHEGNYDFIKVQNPPDSNFRGYMKVNGDVCALRMQELTETVNGSQNVVCGYGNINITGDIYAGGCIYYNCSQPSGCVALGAC